MDTRKLIAFGKATFSITLPKSWVKRNNLKPGAQIAVHEVAQDRLEITPAALQSEDEPEKGTITISSKNEDEAAREIISQYVRGRTLIEIIGNNRGKVKGIRAALHGLLGVEMMEVTPMKIVANVFADNSMINLPHVIRRIEIITYTLFDDTARLIKHDMELDEIFEKDYEVDRHALFGIRQVIKGLERPGYARKLGMNPLELAGTWHIITSLEVISDYARNLSLVFHSTDLLQNLNPAQITQMTLAIAEIRSIYEQTLNAYHKKDGKAASAIYPSIIELSKKTGQMESRSRHRYYPVVIEYEKRIIFRCRDILRVISNLWPEKPEE